MKVFKYNDGTLCYGCALPVLPVTDKGNADYHMGDMGQFVECEITSDGKLVEVMKSA